MKYAHETRDQFVERIKREKGFFGRPSPISRKRIEPRPVEEILADQVAREDKSFGHLHLYGPAEKWSRK